MRYGIIRAAAYLPPTGRQKAALEAASCDVIQEIDGEDFVTDRRVGRLLFDLSHRDEIVVIGLGVFGQTLPQIVRILRNLIQLEVTVVLAGEPQAILSPASAPDDVLGALLAHEPGRGALEMKRIGGGSKVRPLSKYQIEHARKLYAEGASLRAIGLLFQISPNEVWRLIAPTVRVRDDQAAHAGE